MTEHNHNQIMHALGGLEEKADGIISRLDRLNGSVADHAKQLQELKIINAERKGAWKVTLAIAGAVSTLIYLVLNKIL